jgi:hypothetical protein
MPFRDQQHRYPFFSYDFSYSPFLEQVQFLIPSVAPPARYTPTISALSWPVLPYHDQPVQHGSHQQKKGSTNRNSSFLQLARLEAPKRQSRRVDVSWLLTISVSFV